MIFAGVRRARCAAPSRRRARPPRAGPRHATPSTSRSTYRYCTNFAVTGSGLDPRALASSRSRRSATRCWSSATPRTLKVHVHTDEPERATSLFAGAGEVSRLDVADMHEQVEERAERLAGEQPVATCGVLAVVAGEGMAGLFYGARRRRRSTAARR